ncbi:PPE domain-containing protein [Kutzneria sp. NPDC052558]|uniref:PPE domain-containing protein n=1 Tax=Kutzneria sp. NPDC052558 TaxID=3364121 RepID=UPI0037CBA314
MSGDVRWRGYTHQELYDAINSGPGAAASADPAARWAAISGVLAEISGDLSNGIGAAHEHWGGAAAESALGGIAQLARWADAAHADAATVRAGAEAQADYVTRARADMPAPVKAPEPGPAGWLGDLVSLFLGQVDAEIIEAAQDAAATRAFEVMSTYEHNTAANTGSLRAFDPVPVVTAARPLVPSQRGY